MKNNEPFDPYNAIFFKVHPELIDKDYHWCCLESVEGLQSGTLATFREAYIKLRGKYKGRRGYKGQSFKLFITDAQVYSVRINYQITTGKCVECLGSGKAMGRPLCFQCNGTGVAHPLSEP